MEENKSKYLAMGVAGVIGVFGIIFTLIMMINGDPTTYELIDFDGSQEAMDSKIESAGTIISMVLYVMNIALILAIIAVLGFGIYYLATHIKEQKAFLIGVGAVILIVLVGYGLGDSSIPSNDPKILENTSESAARWVDTGIYGMTILFFVAIFSMVGFWAMNLVKRFSK